MPVHNCSVHGKISVKTANTRLPEPCYICREENAEALARRAMMGQASDLGSIELPEPREIILEAAIQLLARRVAQLELQYAYKDPDEAAILRATLAEARCLVEGMQLYRDGDVPMLTLGYFTVPLKFSGPSGRIYNGVILLDKEPADALRRMQVNMTIFPVVGPSITFEARK